MAVVGSSSSYVLVKCNGTHPYAIREDHFFYVCASIVYHGTIIGTMMMGV